MATIDDPTTEKIDGRTYGALKALTEKAAETAMPGKVAVVRPGLIVGPEDPSDRFTYWPVRVARGGEVLAPGSAGRPDPAHRRPRPGRVPRPADRRQDDGRLQRTGPDHDADHGPDAGRLQGGRPQRRDFTWADAEFPREAGRPRLERHAGLGPEQAARRPASRRSATPAPSRRA